MLSGANHISEIIYTFVFNGNFVGVADTVFWTSTRPNENKISVNI